MLCIINKTINLICSWSLGGRTYITLFTFSSTPSAPHLGSCAPAPGMPASISHSGNPATLQAPLSSHFSRWRLLCLSVLLTFLILLLKVEVIFLSSKSLSPFYSTLIRLLHCKHTLYYVKCSSPLIGYVLFYSFYKI